MTASKVGYLKPFMLEVKKMLKCSVSEVTMNKWQGCMIANIKKEEKGIPFLSSTWGAKKLLNCGLTGEEADSNATQIDLLLECVA